MLAPIIRPASQQVEGDVVQALVRIMEDDVNLVCWRRSLAADVERFAGALMAQADLGLAESLVVDIDPGTEPSAHNLLPAYRGFPGYAEFVADISYLMSAFTCLFDVRRIGVRLRLLDHAMCPRWHVDQVPVRLITTYAGPGSEWLGDGAMPRQALGSPASDRYANVEPAGRLGAGDVALFKGERWHGNEQRGVIHRSPRLPDGATRLVMTLDWLG
jgi:hypothetical protein